MKRALHHLKQGFLVPQGVMATRAAILCSMAVTVIGLLICLARPACADALSGLPTPLAQRLEPVAEISLDTLDQDGREQLAAARGRVASAIVAQASDQELADSYGELGALYQVHFVYRLAGTCYDNAMRLAPGEFRWVYYAAYLAASTGQLEQAVAGYAKARQIRPGYLALTLRLADTWRDLNQTDKAMEAYQSVVNSKGLEAAAHYGLGQIALLQREYANAIGHFETALAIQPEASRVHYSLAQALRASGDRDGAEQQFARMGDTLPVFTDPQIESLLALKRGSHVYFIAAMRAYRKQDFAAARDAFAEGLAREPDNVNAHISHARALYLTGDKTQARQELESTLAGKPPTHALGWFLLGILAEEAGDIDTAMQDYQTALRAEPEHAGAHFYLGNASYRRGQYEAAAAHYASSAAAAPENLAVYLPYTGVLLHSTNGLQRAIELVAGARQRFPEQELLEFVQIPLLAGSGDKDSMEAALARARQRVEQQSTPPNRELLALALAATGDFDQAQTLQDALVTEAAWSMPVETGRLSRVLAAYRAGKLPAQEDLFTWSLLQPPEVKGISVFRDYPAPRPY